MRKLLVTLADAQSVDAAKQLFASAYNNGGWQGDYMLLTHQIPEKKLQWFRDKGILIKKCKSITKDRVGKMSPITLSKFYLFKNEFKNWENIVYLDSDIIVNCPIHCLSSMKGFWAVADSTKHLSYQFTNTIKLRSQHYNPRYQIFNSGVIAFSTDIITKETFTQLLDLYQSYKDVVKFGEQGILNLFFYKKWNRLRPIYNVEIYKVTACFLVKLPIMGVLHFIGDKKPWHNNPYNMLWDEHLKRSEYIDFSKTQKSICCQKKKQSTIHV